MHCIIGHGPAAAPRRFAVSGDAGVDVAIVLKQLWIHANCAERNEHTVDDNSYLYSTSYVRGTTTLSAPTAAADGLSPREEFKVRIFWIHVEARGLPPRALPTTVQYVKKRTRPLKKRASAMEETTVPPALDGGPAPPPDQKHDATTSESPTLAKEHASASTEDLGKGEVLVDKPTHEAFHIACDACETWFDAYDLGMSPAEASSYEVWHCDDCIPYHGPSQHKRSRSGLRKRRRIDFVKLNDPASVLEDENSAHIGVAAGDVQEVDFKNMIRQRQKRGIFQSGIGGCLLTITSTGSGAESNTGIASAADNNAGKVMFNSDYANRHGFTRPVLFVDLTPEQLGLKVPPPNAETGNPFTFTDVARLVGPYRPIQVIDSATQLTTTYTLQEYVEYLETRRKDRTRTLNVITLEFSQTPLTELVTEPQFARDVDFVHLHWPQTLAQVTKAAVAGEETVGRGMNAPASAAEAADIMERLEELEDARPKVSKYCLMTAAGSWTDFHVDFGGTAVWYHLFRGTKIFYFIEPSPENLKIYSEWATSTSGGGRSKQAERKAKAAKKSAFLPDLIHAAGGSVYEVVIQQGQTLLIPSGWIHAVYTPHDSLVFGGNFIHRHSLEMQLTIYRLEKQMKVGKEYRFPNYQRLLWYVGRDFLEECDKYTKNATPTSPAATNGEGGGQMQDSMPVLDAEAKMAQRRTQKLCTKYPLHILRGYCALGKELQRWAGSKNKQHSDQYPPGMDVVVVANQLSQMMGECITYLDNKKSEKIRKEKHLQDREKKKEERALAKAQAEAKRAERQIAKAQAVAKKAERQMERQRQIQARKEDAERKRIEREMKRAAKVEERRKGLEKEYEEVAWAQCDGCDEWREVPKEVAESRQAKIEQLQVEDNASDELPFYCSEVGESCKDSATAWKQCESCMAWHSVPKESGAIEGADNAEASGISSSTSEQFVCEFVGKKCTPKKFMRAKLALSG